MRTKNIEKLVDVPDGQHRGRQGGDEVVLRLSTGVIRFKVHYDAGPLSIGVYVTIKDGWATVVSNNFY